MQKPNNEFVETVLGSLYLFSVPRGYTDGFYQWCKQVAAICLTAFMQTTLLFLGMMTFPAWRMLLAWAPLTFISR